VVSWFMLLCRQASSVKDLPNTERLKSAKFTGLRWDIDPLVIEYFRYLLNDVVGNSGTGRKRTTSQNFVIPSGSGGGSSGSYHSKPLKATSSMLTNDRRLCVVPMTDTARAPLGHSEARRCSMFRQFSTVQQQQQQPAQPIYDNSEASASSKAKARWKKVLPRLSSHFNQSVTIL